MIPQNTNTLLRDELESHLNDLLDCDNFKDYGPNGLQVEGKSQIERIAFAVSADLKTIQKAKELKADALIVHHGLLWKFKPCEKIVRAHGKRIRTLIKNDINLYAYHLPLDAHRELGNAARLAKKIGLKNLQPFGTKSSKGPSLGVWGEFDTDDLRHNLLAEQLKPLNHRPILDNKLDDKRIKKMAIITGGASDYWHEAYELGMDAYLTGEMSEHHFHDSREADISYFAIGHHASEKEGVLGLQEHLKKSFHIDQERLFFIDSLNPA